MSISAKRGPNFVEMYYQKIIKFENNIKTKFNTYCKKC